MPAKASVRVATVQVFWSDLEPVQGQKTIVPITSVLDKAQSLGLAGVRLRIMAGAQAPDWAKAFGGGPIAYNEPQSSIAATVPAWWNSSYEAAWTSLIDFVASKVDSDPRLLAVFAPGAMSYYAEPFIRGVSDLGNCAALIAAGYTKAADQAAEQWQLDVLSAFKQTPVGMSYNPWQFCNADGSAGASQAFMGQMMDYQIGLFGQRTILQNNSIRSSYITSPPAFYNEFLARPGYVHQFQAAGATRVGDEDATIRWAKSYLGANGVEYSNTLTDAQYAALDALLKS